MYQGRIWALDRFGAKTESTVYERDFWSNCKSVGLNEKPLVERGTNSADKYLNELSFCLSNLTPGDGWETTRVPVSKEQEKIQHTKDGRLSEEWLIKRDAQVCIISVEPQIGKDVKPDKQNLNDARKTLIERIDSSKMDEGQKLQLFQAMQKLEQRAREGKLGGEIDLVRTDLASTYLQTARLIEAKFAQSEVIDSLELSSKNTSKYFSDSAGNFTEDGKKADLKKDNDEIREHRENEIWNAKLTRVDSVGFASTTLNGSEIETFKLKFDGQKIIDVELLIGRDPHPDEQGLKESRTRLFAAIQNSDMSQSAKLEFFKDLTHIEHRARQGEMGSDIAKVRTELSDTYKQMGRLLDGSKQSKIPIKDRVVIARQLAHQLADTMDIDQGMVSDSCRITTAECRLSVVRPSVVAKIITDTAIDGETTFGKTTIRLDDQSLRAASDIAKQIPRPQNDRSYASQLFQLTCMNLLGTDPKMVKEHIFFANLDETKPRIPDYSRLVFQQKTEGSRNDRGQLYKRNNGMTIYGMRNDGRLEQITKPGELREGTNQPLLQACMTQRLLDMVDPGRHAGVVLAHRDVELYARELHSGEHPSDTRGLVLYANEQELEKLIAAAKREGRLPLIIANRNHEPDPGEAEFELKHNESNHIITIRDYIPSKGDQQAKLVTDDQFGRNDDERNITVSQLYEVTRPGSPRKTKPKP